MQRIRSKMRLVLLMMISLVIGLSYQIVVAVDKGTGTQSSSNITTTTTSTTVGGDENEKIENLGFKMKVYFDRTNQLYFTKLYFGSNQTEENLLFDTLSRITWIYKNPQKNFSEKYSSKESTTSKDLKEQLVYVYWYGTRLIGNLIKDTIEPKKQEKNFKIDSIFLEVKNIEGN